MQTDQLFIDILQAFFQHFLFLFLPDVASEIEPGSITLLNPEIFTDIPSGARRQVDLVAQVHARSGVPLLVLIHTEVQAEREEGFGWRLYEYNALLRLRLKMPVLSLALVLYSNEDPGIPAISFQRVAETVLGQELTLVEYWQIAVRDLEATTFLDAVPALAAGFAALMRIPKHDRVRVKAALLDRLRRSDLDERGASCC